MMAWYTANAVVVQATMTTLLLALSIQLPLRVGVFSFAGVGCFGIGGYTAAILYTKFDVDTWPAVALGTLLAGGLCYLLGLIIHKLSGLYLGMATIAFSLIVAVAATNGGSLTGGASGIFGALGGITNLHVLLLLALVVAGLAISEYGRFGRMIDTVREDPELAAALGINVGRYRKLTFLASGLIGGLAGAVTTLLRSTITPAEVNFHMVVVALTVIIIGGSSSWLGALIGAIVITWLPTVLSFVADWESIIYGFLVALAAIFLPGGVLGLAKDLIHRWRARRRPTPPAPPASEAEKIPGGEPSSPATERSLASTQGGTS
ncbi:branched-chain amino acid ABC transporter permease [Zafaria cholistanensis]|nr:branched-chain amino acid ABC transporter permease [Zafaria cholistanensis]